VHVCGVSPCVFVVRDSVGGRALPCPQQRRSEGNWHQEHVQSCACRWGWMCGAHNEVGTDVPDLRVGGVVRAVRVDTAKTHRGGGAQCAFVLVLLCGSV